MFVGGGVGESACGAKAACRRRQALPGCCAALPKYKTIVTAWRLEQPSKGRRREIKWFLGRPERLSLSGGFPEVTTTAAGTRLAYTRPRERQKPFPSLYSGLQDRPSGRFLNVGAFGLGLVPFRTFSLIISLSLRPPRRRGPSFCVDRKKAKNDQGEYPPWIPRALGNTAGPPSSGGLMVGAKR